MSISSKMPGNLSNFSEEKVVFVGVQGRDISYMQSDTRSQKLSCIVWRHYLENMGPDKHIFIYLGADEICFPVKHTACQDELEEENSQTFILVTSGKAVRELQRKQEVWTFFQ